MKEKSLSEKIIKHCMGTPVVCTKINKDVREAVLRLKSWIKKEDPELVWNNVIWRINEIFGSKLT